MSKFYNLNGKIVGVEEPGLINNRAFHYGDGLFETIRINNGRALYLDKHFQRLSQGLEILKIKNHLDFKGFSAEVKKCIESNKINKSGRLRITAFREVGGYYTPKSDKLNFLIEVDKLVEEGFCLNDQGFKIDVCEDIVLHKSPLSNLKTLNALPYVMAGIYKREKFLDDVLLLNSDGNISESIHSNVFLFAGSTLLTPSLDQACVAGTMRSEVLKVAERLGIRTVEAEVKVGEMEIAEEVFLTNAVKGIQWVAAFRKKRYFNSTSKKILEEVNQSIS